MATSPVDVAPAEGEVLSSCEGEEEEGELWSWASFSDAALICGLIKRRMGGV